MGDRTVAPAEIAVQPAEIRSQRTQTAQVRGQAIAMSEKSSNFAAHLSKESKAALRPRDEEALRNR